MASFISKRLKGDYISLEEARKRADVSREELVEALEQGAIKKIEIGSAFFIDQDSLDVWLHSPEPSTHKEHSERGRHKEPSEFAVSTKPQAGQNRSGPEGFVFNSRDLYTALPLFGVVLLALLLATPVHRENPRAALIADALVGVERSADASLQEIPESELDQPHVQTETQTALETSTQRSLLANALSGSAEMLQGLVRLFHEAFDMFKP